MNAVPFPKSYRERNLNSGRNRFLARLAAAVGVAIFVCGYFLYQAKGFILSPHLDITSPEDGQTFSSTAVRVEGNTDAGVSVTVNGARVSSDGGGHFSQGLLLAPGIHVLEITAKDRFGKEKEITRQINVK